MKKQPFLLACVAACFIISCTEGEIDDEFNNLTPPVSTHFSEAEMTVLRQSLNLKAEVFNYANMELPAHYRTEEAEIQDNTPAHNSITDMGATLGRVLFYDKKLSVDNSISCASCHQQAAAFSDTARFSTGLNGQMTRRNSMSLINSRYYEAGSFLWDERAMSLEEQVLLPIQDHMEMGMELSQLEARLQGFDYYQVLFQKAFGTDQVTSGRISIALSQFIRSIVASHSKFDQGLIAAGNPAVEEGMTYLPNFTAQENLGLDIFINGRNGATCGYCHGSAQNVNDIAKNNGLALQYADQGKGGITGNPADNATFKVPSLRNVVQTAPYMHDGRFKTLMEVVDHYSDHVQQHPNLNFRLTTDEKRGGEVLRLNLNQEEKEAVVAFLNTLTDHDILTDEKYSDPFK